MLPQLLHTYTSYIQDSRRWERFTPRVDDIIVATPPKAGTTWTQEILLHLIFLGQEVPYREELSPWLELRTVPLDEVLKALDEQRHRRFIKTHLPLDGIPFFPQIKYLVIGRDPRDIFMSMWHHYCGFTPEFITYANNLPGLVGDPLPPPPAAIHDFWQPWISRGRVDWQEEGYPFFGSMYHFQSWWNFRHLPNLLFVHYADLLADQPSQIGRIASFLQIPATEEQIAEIAQLTTLDAMRSRAVENKPQMKKRFKEGALTFFHKGSNGRWHDVLTESELAMYEQKATKVLTPACKSWLEQGMVTLA